MISMTSRPVWALPLFLLTLTSCWYDTASISPLVTLSRPQDVDVDEAGKQLYIADTENNRIHYIDLQSVRERVTPPLAGQAGRCQIMPKDAGNDSGGCFQNGALDEALFRKPTGVAVNSDGTAIFVADTGNHRIRVIRTDKDQVSTLAGSEAAGFKDGPALKAMFDTPTGLDFDYDNKKIYVADSKNSRVRVIKVNYFDPSASNVDTLCHESSCDGGYSFKLPVDVACNSDCSRLYVADKTANAIVEVDTKTRRTKVIAQDTTFGGGLSGIAVDSNNAIYVTVNDTIWVYSGGGSKKKVPLSVGDRAYGASSSPATSLRSPTGLAVTLVEGEIQLFVADTRRDQIRQITMSSTFPPDAGTQDLAADAADAAPVDAAPVDAAAADAAAADTAPDTAGQ